MASAQARMRRVADDFWDAVQPAEQMRHDAALRQAVDMAGRPNRDVFRRILPPLVLRWRSGDTGFEPVARAGRTSLALARAEVAPSGGACVVTLSWESATQGLTTLGTVRIPAGSRFGQEVLAVDLPAGAWVKAEISTASGATGVSTALTVDLV